jgi:dTDP-6-deoxy-L-talose 4-dehydrogenase (NAD+)
MSTILVSGASGFLGQHVVRALLEDGGHHIIVTGRSEAKLRRLNTDYISYDLNERRDDCFDLLGRPDILIHLAWEDLPKYQNLTHIEHNLQNSYWFLKAMILQGVDNITVAGTCYEYGQQNGCLSEDRPVYPATSYSIAKDTLRRFLQLLQQQYPFRLLWTRLFYMYGPGQNPNSLIAALDEAIDSGEKVFNMSNGEQLRDYLHVKEVAGRLVRMALNPMCSGIVNICNGQPVSIRKLVERHLVTRDADIQLNLGHYSIPDYEPMAFWGDSGKQNKFLGQSNAIK